MMVDAQRRELDQDAGRCQQQDDADQRHGAARDPARGGEGGSDEAAQQEQRHGDAGDKLCIRRAEQRPQEEDEGSDRHVDDSRPVHRPAIRRVHPMLGHIEKRLAGQPVAHLHQSHRIIGIAKGKRGKAAMGEPQQDEAAGQPGQPCPERGAAQFRRGRRRHICESHRR